jgi:adenylate cyclase
MLPLKSQLKRGLFMGVEIERKFLVQSNSWRSQAYSPKRLVQGYLSKTPGCTVRVRRVDSTEGQSAWITIKGKTERFSRPEYEYQIPHQEAVELLEHFCKKALIDKTRYHCKVDDKTWEIDEFAGENQGLMIAEITLTDEDQPFVRPDWLGEEVSHDLRYFNSNLIDHPFTNWRQAART